MLRYCLLALNKSTVLHVNYFSCYPNLFSWSWNITNILSTPQWSKHIPGTRSTACLAPLLIASFWPCGASMSRGHALRDWQKPLEVPPSTWRRYAADPQAAFHTAYNNESLFFFGFIKVKFTDLQTSTLHCSRKLSSILSLCMTESAAKIFAFSASPKGSLAATHLRMITVRIAKAHLRALIYVPW